MPKPQNKLATVLVLVIFFCLHFAATLGAPYYFSSAGLVTLFWPATGIALAAVLVGGYRYAFATLLSCVATGLLTPEKGVAQVFFSAANALEIFVARYWLLRVAGINANFDRATDYLKFILFAGVVLPIPAALAAAGAVKAFTNVAVPYWQPAAEWWMGDSLGILSVAPLLLIWRKLPTGWLDRKRIAEGLIGIALTIGSGIFFLSGFAESHGAYPRAFVAFIFISWAATRFGRHATLLVIAIIFIQTLAATYSSASLNRSYEFANIWLFLVTLSTVGMSLATAFHERRTSMQKLHEILEAYRREEARRRASDHALRLSSIDFQRLVETAEEGIWTIDTQGKTTFANARMASMLGYTPEEMLGKNFLDFMPEADRKAGVERLSRRNSGQREGHECDLLHKNGTRISTFMHTSPISDIEGTITGALAMVTDITVRKRTERALRESEDRYRKLIDAASDAIIAHQSGFIVFANPAAVAMLGAASPAEIVGRNALDFVHPDDREMVIQRMKEVMQPGAHLPIVEERFIRPDGKVIRAEVSGTNITWDGRSASMVIARKID